MRTLVILILVALLATGPAAAQSHDHDAASGPVAFVLHDGPANGRAVVGGFTHFGFALLDEDGAPVVHRDAEFSIVQNGRTLLSTTSTHEYDGLFSFDVVFHEPGPYVVLARSDGFEERAFEGVAVAPADETVARIETDVAPAGEGLVEVEVRIVDAAGALVPHSDAMLEVRDVAGRLVARTHVHIHEDPIRFTQRVAGDGETLQVTAFNAFPTGNRPDFRAVVASFPLEAEGVAALPPQDMPPAPDAPDARPLDPTGAQVGDEKYRLFTMYDPQAIVGLGSPIRLSALLGDANGTPVQHVDFTFTVRGPLGPVFQSESLHEYDGVFEWTGVPDAPGTYSGTIRASYGAAEHETTFSFDVLPPVLPLNPGPNSVRVGGLDGVTALTPADVTFRVASDAGLPADHTEIDVTVYREGEPALYQFKLHGHDGTSGAQLAFPEPGIWLVRVEPFTLLPQAALLEPVLLEVQVGEPLPGITPAAVDGEAVEDALRNVPAPGAALVLALAGGAALVRSRRRSA